MKFFVTGGTGHIGSSLVKWLVDKNHEVIVLTRQENPPPMRGVRYVTGDIMDTDKYQIGLRDAVVIHLAADVRVGVMSEAEKVEMFRTNFSGTVELLDAFERNKGKHFITVSSRQVYGSARITEDTPLRGKRNSVYAHSKILAHQAVRKRKKTTVLIPGMVFSSSDRDTGVNFVYSMFKRGLKVGFGLETPNSYTYLGDLVEIITRIAADSKTFGKEYIISNGVLTTSELYEIFEDVSGVRAPTREIPKWILTSIAGFLSKVTKLTGKKFLLNQETINNVSIPTIMANRKSVQELGVVYTPLRHSLVACLQLLEIRNQNRISIVSPEQVAVKT